MTKDEMITWLEETIRKHKDTTYSHDLIASIQAANLLASLKGWHIQHCSRGGGRRRDPRSDLLGKKV